MRIIFFLILLLPLLIISCEDEESTPQYPTEEKPIYLSPEAEAAVVADNQFGFEIFQELSSLKSGENIMISPLSLSQALLMAYNGSDGTTKKAFESTLHLPDLTLEEINESNKELIQKLIEVDPGVTIQNANSVWYKNSYQILDGFINNLENYYNADVFPSSFDSETVDEINNWVYNKTNGKIDEIVDQLDPMSLMLLINALYFNGNWKYQFDEANTSDDDFYLSDGSPISVPFMEQTITSKLYQNTDFSMIELPYGRGNYSMLVFLPKEGKTIETIINQLNANNYNQWLEEIAEVSELTVKLPKFSFEYEQTLNDVLMSLGLEEAFSAYDADFSKIIADLQIYISRVKHKTHIDVNEKGTQAAAVTSVEIVFTSVQSATFKADKPFLFMIREKYTNAICFIGIVEDPS